MSGIFGVLDSKHRINVDSMVSKMADLMSHFDWHSHDTFLDSDSGVALGRLSIGVFNSEPQPVSTNNQRYVGFFSGELDDGARLRLILERAGHVFVDGSDAEVAVHLYEEYKERFVEQLRGHFILSIWDKVDKVLRIVNDRFGSYPLYYAQHNGRFVFAPELKAVLCDPAFSRTLDMSALAEYVRFQSLLGDKTFFEGAHLLRGGSYLRYCLVDDVIEIYPYWSYSKIQPFSSNIGLDEAVEECGRILRRSVNKYSQQGLKVGLFLSGGLDSRLILGYLNVAEPPVVTVTYGLEGCKDVRYAQRLAQKSKTQHHFYPFSGGEWVADFARLHMQLTEGSHSWIHAHGLSVMEQVRAHMNVNYSGFAGDQGFNDLSVYLAPDEMAFRTRLYDLFCNEFTWPSVSEGEATQAFTPGVSKGLDRLAWDSLQKEIDWLGGTPNIIRASAMGLSYDMRAYFQYVTFHRAFIEDRFPFLDYDYIDFIFALPPIIEYSRRLRKMLIRRDMPGLARVPAAKDDLPIAAGRTLLFHKIALKVRQTMPGWAGGIDADSGNLYADYEGWLRNELKGWAEAILFGPGMKERGLFNVKFLQSIWARLQTGLEPNLVGKIAPFMSYELMLEHLLDDE